MLNRTAVIRTIKMDKIKVGRPIKYSHKEKRAILDALKEYIEVEEYPTMPAFCTQQKVSKRRIYEWARGENENSDTRTNYPLKEYFDELIELMNAKQEKKKKKNVMLGNISPAFAIFKLKQRGFNWTDKQDIDLSGNMKISIGLPPEFKTHGN
jgi:hypothetical protein